MVVMPRERWTDERLGKAFDRVDGDLRELRVEMRKGSERIDQRFEQVDKRFERIDRRFEQVDDRFDSMQRNMIICFVTLSASLIGGLIATQL
jgi:chaperonin cofactor prefoldin